MPAFASLLRAVNVGGNNIVKMSDLVELYGELGLGEARSLLQSGNVVFTTKTSNAGALEKKIARAIEQRFGVACDVMVRSRGDLDGVIAANPLREAAKKDPSRLLVTFLASEPSAEKTKGFLAMTFATEETAVVGRHVYIHYKQGAGKTKLTNVVLERALMTRGTARNWNTTVKLAAMLAELEE